MRILITGSHGFIGSHVSHALEIDPEPHIITRLDRHICDLSDNKEVASVADPSQFDCVIHLASVPSVPEAMARPHEVSRNNLNCFINALELARRTAQKKIIFASSSSVYGEGGRPLSLYASLKKSEELIVENYAKDLNYIGLRLFNVFAEDSPKRTVIPIWHDNIKNNVDCLAYGASLIRRDFTHIDNVIHAVKLALKGQPKESNNAIYDIGCGKSTSLMDLFNILAQWYPNYAGKLIELGPNSFDVKESQADFKDAHNLLGYLPQVSLEEGIKRCVFYESRNTGSGNCWWQSC